MFFSILLLEIAKTCTVLQYHTQSSVTSFLMLATSNPGLMALYIRRDLMRNELFGVCRVRCVCASEVHWNQPTLAHFRLNLYPNRVDFEGMYSSFHFLMLLRCHTIHSIYKIFIRKMEKVRLQEMQGLEQQLAKKKIETNWVFSG